MTLALMQIRRGTSAEWLAANPTLRSGELGFETNTLKLKCGNGTTAWDGLPYVSGGGGGGAVDSVNGQTGAVVLTTTNIPEGTNDYYTDARVNTLLTHPGPIGSVTPNTGAFTVLNSGKLIAAESADFSTGGLLFGENGNDTGFTSPSDGEIYQWGNAAIGSKWNHFGLAEMRGIPILFPDAQGIADSVLTNNGAGVLSWAPIPAPALPQDLTESFDPDNQSGTRFSIASVVDPVADSSSSDINELQVYTENSSAFPVHGVWSMSVRNQNIGSADVAYNGLIQAGQTIGNGTDPITVGQVYGFSGYTSVVANAVASSVSLFEYGFDAAAGSSVGPFSYCRSAGTVDQFTASVNSFTAGMQIGTVAGFVTAYGTNHNIATANDSITAFADSTQVGNMPNPNSGYSTLNAGPSISGSVNGFSSFNTHPQIGSVVYDFSAWEDGSNVTTVGRNVNYVNHHPNFATVIDNYNGWNHTAHVVTQHGGFNELNLSSQIESLAGDYRGASISPQVTSAPAAAFDVTITPAADVSGSMAGAYFGFGIPYSVGGDNYTPWLKVSGAGSAPGGQPNPIEVNVATNDSAATIATAIVAALTSYGAPLSTNVTITDLGGSFRLVANTTGQANKVNTQGNSTKFTYIYTAYGAGGSTAYGISVNMSQASGYDKANGRIQAISFQEGSFQGSMTFPFTDLANATPINSINVGLTAAASATIANADTFAFATLQNIQLGSNSHITSGVFGVGAAGTGAINLLQMDDQSSIADVAGCFYAFLPIGGSGAGGVAGMLHGYEFAGLPGFVTGSPSTITSAKAFEARTPAGPFTTSTAWGIHADSGYDQNYFGGALKIGATGGDTTTNSSIALEVADKAIRLATIDTAARDALTPLAGMVVFNTDTTALEYYNGTAWV